MLMADYFKSLFLFVSDAEMGTLSDQSDPSLLNYSNHLEHAVSGKVMLSAESACDLKCDHREFARVHLLCGAQFSACDVHSGNY